MTDDPSLKIASELAAGFEGFSPTPYLDKLATKPVWTIGYGSTWQADGSPVTENTPAITKEQGVQLAAIELRHTFEVIRREAQTPLNDNQEAALESFIFNVGAGAFVASTMLRKLRAGDYAGAAAEFTRWDMAGGKHLAGLLRRRQAERDLFLRVMKAPPTAPRPDSAASHATLTADDLNAAELGRITPGA